MSRKFMPNEEKKEKIVKKKENDVNVKNKQVKKMIKEVKRLPFPFITKQKNLGVTGAPAPAVRLYGFAFSTDIEVVSLVLLTARSSSLTMSYYLCIRLSLFFRILLYLFILKNYFRRYNVFS